VSLLFKSDLFPEGVYGLWHTSEPDEYFLENMEIYSDERAEFDKLKSSKRSEWLSSRYLLHLLSQRSIRGACKKDEYGKPYLENSPYFISISHSADYTAVIASSKLVGIDIQVITPKIERIISRFAKESEYAQYNSLLHYHVIWGAKEAMYKAYGKKSLDFKKNMHVESFDYKSEGFFFRGYVEKGEIFQNYTLFCRQFQDLILVYAIEE